jgi:hypothetical protein
MSSFGKGFVFALHFLKFTGYEETVKTAKPAF